MKRRAVIAALVAAATLIGAGVNVMKPDRVSASGMERVGWPSRWQQGADDVLVPLGTLFLKDDRTQWIATVSPSSDGWSGESNVGRRAVSVSVKPGQGAKDSPRSLSRNPLESLKIVHRGKALELTAGSPVASADADAYMRSAVPVPRELFDEFQRGVGGVDQAMTLGSTELVRSLRPAEPGSGEFARIFFNLKGDEGAPNGGSLSLAMKGGAKAWGEFGLGDAQAVIYTAPLGSTLKAKGQDAIWAADDDWIGLHYALVRDDDGDGRVALEVSSADAVQPYSVPYSFGVN